MIRIGAVPVPLRKAIGDAIDAQQVEIVRAYLATCAHGPWDGIGRCAGCGVHWQDR